MALSPKKEKWLIGLLIVLPVIIAAFLIITYRSGKPFLYPEKGAAWIYIDRPFIMEAQREGESVAYRKRFSVEKTYPQATLTVRALQVPEVFLDGRRLAPLKSDIGRWKGTQEFDISGLLTPGMHDILIKVFNKSGPAVLIAYGSAVGLSTGPGWEASYDELIWTPAVPADRKKEVPEIARHFVPADTALLHLLPVYVPVFLVVFFLTLAASSPGANLRERIRRSMPGPSGVRWILLALWGVLAGNNILKIYLDVGMDVQQHYEYIEYIARLWKVPLAPEGWQMFQSPLFYMISALLWYPLSRLLDISAAMMLLRIIPLLCGLLQVELSYRAMKTVFPQKGYLQIWGTVIGGLMPMNLYISQVVGNEPLSALLSAYAVLLGFVLLTSELRGLPEKHIVLLGTALGLALLTKVSAVLLIPLSVVLLVFVLRERGQSPGYIVSRVSFFVGIIFVISGWYYIRNWLELGRPFVGGWESTFWWQDPGYRTISDLLSFGRSLSEPIYSSVQGFWDSLYSTLWLDGGLSGTGIYKYRPPWHYGFMLSGALLSLVPSAGLLAGILSTLRSPLQQTHRAQLYSVVCLGVYVAALLYLYISVPVYSTAKATYTLGLIPCYAVLCVTGLDIVAGNNLMKAAVNAGLACWAVSAYCSYFVW